jgi:hypothetical protein
LIFTISSTTDIDSLSVRGGNSNGDGHDIGISHRPFLGGREAKEGHEKQQGEGALHYCRKKKKRKKKRRREKNDKNPPSPAKQTTFIEGPSQSRIISVFSFLFQFGLGGAGF